MGGIYVETVIDAPMDEVWAKSQDPEQHVRWDLRFTKIAPTSAAASRQDGHREFEYSTRIGAGMAVRGTGSWTTTTDREGARVSSLTFASKDRKSLIREGAGYWRYVPTPQGTRFLTWYDYRTRWGALGSLLDLVFRPLLGWATALSFDRFRLWLEHGIDPASSLRAFAQHAVARVALAFLFTYQGLVPKILVQDADELAMMRAGGVPEAMVPEALLILGIAEVAYGLLLLVAWRSRLLLWFLLPGMALVTAGVLLTAPHFGVSAFNVVSLNAAVVALAVVGLTAGPHLISGRNTLRRVPAEAR